MGYVYVIPENVMSKIHGFTDDYEKNENEFEGNDFKALLKEAVLLMNLVIEESSEEEYDDEEECEQFPATK
jgi:hypothetical protein